MHTRNFVKALKLSHTESFQEKSDKSPNIKKGLSTENKSNGITFTVGSD